MPSEAYSWPEGSVSFWSGNAAPIASALLAYAENLNFSPARGYDNRAAAGGLYRDHITGRYATLNIGAMYTKDNTIVKMFESETAIHCKLMHSSVNGTAGWILYSGRIDSLPLAGSEGQVFKYTVNYHANAWSAF